MEMYNTREIKQKINFKPGKSSFEGYYSACSWAKENGYSHGSMDGTNPIAMWKDDSFISKWHNLSDEEQNSCDAIMIGNFRDGEVNILIF